MFGIDVKEERGLGEIAATAAVAWVGIAMVVAALVVTLGPLDGWLRAVERDKLPTFEERIEVRAPGPPQISRDAEPSGIAVPATLERAPEPARPPARAGRGARP